MGTSRLQHESMCGPALQWIVVGDKRKMGVACQLTKSFQAMRQQLAHLYHLCSIVCDIIVGHDCDTTHIVSLASWPGFRRMTPTRVFGSGLHEPGAVPLHKHTVSGQANDLPMICQDCKEERMICQDWAHELTCKTCT